MARNLVDARASSRAEARRTRARHLIGSSHAPGYWCGTPPLSKGSGSGAGSVQLRRFNRSALDRKTAVVERRAARDRRETRPRNASINCGSWARHSLLGGPPVSSPK